jgi:3,4-dihydroxy 2-butanone 4-phosphate synthase/GTP cyclohydrolase II
MKFGTIEQAIEDIRQGKLVLVADDEDRESEGDLVGAAEQVTPDIINFMATHGRGLICLTLTSERCHALGLPQMAEESSDAYETAFTVSVDAAKRFGVTTGISAADRAKTVQVAIDPATVPSDLRRPGHVFPLRGRPGGVLQRVGHTEASVDLARLAGLYPRHHDAPAPTRAVRDEARSHLRDRGAAGGVSSAERASRASHRGCASPYAAR